MLYWVNVGIISKKVTYYIKDSVAQVKEKGWVFRRDLKLNSEEACVMCKSFHIFPAVTILDHR